MATIFVIKNGPLPPVKPLLELNLRDTSIRLGNENYFKYEKSDWRCALFGDDLQSN